MPVLSIIGWIIIGFLAGALSGLVVRNRTAGGCLANILIGVLGGVLGGFLARELLNKERHLRLDQRLHRRLCGRGHRALAARTGVTARPLLRAARQPARPLGYFFLGGRVSA